MSFLLAAQVTARKPTGDRRARIQRLLETNQRAFFKAACKILDADQLAARARPASGD
jgi:hypothetical protein